MSLTLTECLKQNSTLITQELTCCKINLPTMKTKTSTQSERDEDHEQPKLNVSSLFVISVMYFTKESLWVVQSNVEDRIYKSIYQIYRSVHYIIQK